MSNKSKFLESRNAKWEKSQQKTKFKGLGKATEEEGKEKRERYKRYSEARANNEEGNEFL